MIYAYVGAGVIFLMLSTATAVQTHRLALCKDEFAKFQGGVAALGAAASLAAKEKEAKDKLNKEKADELHRAAIDTLNATVRRLRNARPSSSFVPPAPAAASRPDLACYDRPELERATGKFIEGLRGLADEGSAATVDLNTAKTWAGQL